MSQAIVIKNDTLKLEMVVSDSDTKSRSEIHKQFLSFCDTNHLADSGKIKSPQSFKRLLEEDGSIVKGWVVTHVSNSAKVVTQSLDRQIAKREERRADKKLTKKAKKMAERSLRNKSREFMQSQKPKQEDPVIRPKVSPIMMAVVSAIRGVTGGRR